MKGKAVDRTIQKTETGAAFEEKLRRSPTPGMDATVEAYARLTHAYRHFNQALFDGALTGSFLTLNTKHKNAAGFFGPDRFATRTGVGGLLHEIALNHEAFKAQTDTDILAVLAHEMAHQWQQDFGSPSRRGYHNKEWARKMEDIGLMPSSTGREGGRRTGQRMSHYILPDGLFAMAAAELIAGGWVWHWNGVPFPVVAKKKDTSKVKYVCPKCEAKAWAKVGSPIGCTKCRKAMVAEDGEE